MWGARCFTMACAKQEDRQLILGSATDWLCDYEFSYLTSCPSQVVLVVKNLPANAGDIKDVGSIPGLGRSHGGGHGNQLQYPCLENPMDRGWRATAHSGAKSQTRLKGLNTHAHVCNLPGCLLSPPRNGATIANHKFFP